MAQWKCHQCELLFWKQIHSEIVENGGFPQDNVFAHFAQDKNPVHSTLMFWVCFYVHGFPNKAQSSGRSLHRFSKRGLTGSPNSSWDLLIFTTPDGEDEISELIQNTHSPHPLDTHDGDLRSPFEAQAKLSVHWSLLSQVLILSDEWGLRGGHADNAKTPTALCDLNEPDKCAIFRHMFL